MNRLRYILQSKYLIKSLVGLFLIINLIYTNYYPFKSKYNSKENTFTGIITKYEVEETKIKIQIKGKEKLIVYINNIDNLDLGDKATVSGEYVLPKKATIPNNFDYQKYLYNNHIFYIMYAKKLKIDKTEVKTLVLLLLQKVQSQRTEKSQLKM